MDALLCRAAGVPTRPRATSKVPNGLQTLLNGFHDLIANALQGRWGAYSTAGDIEGLMASLERRGVRELALAEASSVSTAPAHLKFCEYVCCVWPPMQAFKKRAS